MKQFSVRHKNTHTHSLVFVSRYPKGKTGKCRKILWPRHSQFRFSYHISEPLNQIYRCPHVTRKFSLLRSYGRKEMSLTVLCFPFIIFQFANAVNQDLKGHTGGLFNDYATIFRKGNIIGGVKMVKRSHRAQQN
jgi:hypothetical protein